MVLQRQWGVPLLAERCISTERNWAANMHSAPCKQKGRSGCPKFRAKPLWLLKERENEDGPVLQPWRNLVFCLQFWNAELRFMGSDGLGAPEWVGASGWVFQSLCPGGGAPQARSAARSDDKMMTGHKLTRSLSATKGVGNYKNPRSIKNIFTPSSFGHRTTFACPCGPAIFFQIEIWNAFMSVFEWETSRVGFKDFPHMGRCSDTFCHYLGIWDITFVRIPLGMYGFALWGQNQMGGLHLKGMKCNYFLWSWEQSQKNSLYFYSAQLLACMFIWWIFFFFMKWWCTWCMLLIFCKKCNLALHQTLLFKCGTRLFHWEPSNDVFAQVS